MEIYLGENRLKIYMDPTLKKDRQFVGIVFERYYRLTISRKCKSDAYISCMIFGKFLLPCLIYV